MTRADDLARAVVSRTAAGIATEVQAAVADATLPPGTRLPTVRAFAEALGVSPTTVHDAWNRLLSAGVIRTEGRRGTFVAPTDGKRTVQTGVGPVVQDVAQGDPDLALLPPLGPALAHAAASPELNRLDFAYVTDELRAAVAPTWPYEPSAWTTADGGKHAAQLALQSLGGGHRPVAVEQPTAQRTLAVLHELGRTCLPVRWDDAGPRPDDLEHAVAERGADTFVWQPRAHYPTGRTVTPDRLAEIAAVLARRPDVTVVEDDAIGPLASARPVSLGSYLPDAVLHVRTYDPAYGLDLRTAVVTGSLEAVRRVNRARGMLGVWNSRILQDSLAWLLTDRDATRTVRGAARTYARRREGVRDALTTRGVRTTGDDGLVLWVEVADEEAALTVLRARGVVAGLGSVCWLDAADRRHVRLPTATLDVRRPERERVADAVAEAAVQSARHASARRR